MKTGNVSSKVLTLDLQLALHSAVSAGIEFGQPLQLLSTTVDLSFIGNTMTVSSNDGTNYAPDLLYSYATSFSREGNLEIHFELNTLAMTFTLSVNDTLMA